MERRKKNYLKDIDNLEKKHLDEVKDLKNENLKLYNKITDLNNQISYKDIQLLDIQKKIDNINITYEKLENDNNLLLKENNELKEEGEDLKNALNNLKILIQQREDEYILTQKISENKIKKLTNDLNKYKEILDNKEKEINEMKDNLNKIKEEKKYLIDKIKEINDEYELNSENINYKYKNKYIKNYEIDKIIYEKDEEINSLNKYISKIKKEYNELIDKKKYYKNQCKISNDRIDIIKNNLTQEQIQKIEKEYKEKMLNSK